MWVCRAGKEAFYYDYFLQNSRIFLAWDGYKIDLSHFTRIGDFRNIVAHEKQTDNAISISNWAGQLCSFVNRMEINDLVLVPDKGSHFFALAKVVGDYCYTPDEDHNICHQRAVMILLSEIPKSIFPQDVQYGLRAYRTVYRVKQEERILQLIDNWKQKGR